MKKIIKKKLKKIIKNGTLSRKGELMNVFIILSILIVAIGVFIMTASSSEIFKFNWNEKTGLQKIQMIVFYSVLLYLLNIIFWFIK